MRSWVAVLLTVLGCGGGTADEPPDSSEQEGYTIPCGSEVCSLPGNACCVAPDPATDRCDVVDDSYCMGDYHPLGCDGSEDCGDGLVCCYNLVATFCADPATCAAQPVSAVMCHDASQCAAGESCCPLLEGRPYSACSPACR